MLSPELYEKTATFAAFNHMQATVEAANVRAQASALQQQLQAAAQTIQANEASMNGMREEIAKLQAECVARRVNGVWVGHDYTPDAPPLPTAPPAPAAEPVATSEGGTPD